MKEGQEMNYVLKNPDGVLEMECYCDGSSRVTKIPAEKIKEVVLSNNSDEVHVYGDFADYFIDYKETVSRICEIDENEVEKLI